MKLLQIDFQMQGPWGQEMTEAFTDLAKNIAEAEGLVWKVWTENKEKQEAGGIYVFTDEQSLDKYLKIHTERLQSFGITEINSKKFDVNEDLTKITRGTSE